MKKISLKSKWEDFKKPADFVAWLALAKADGQGMDAYWGDLEGCVGCVHIDCENVWCNLCDAPATRNPILNMLGMACCGAGYEGKPDQLSLFHNVADNSPLEALTMK